MTTNWWKSVNCSDLAQGDLLQDCLIPKFSGRGDGEIVTEKVIRSRVISSLKLATFQTRRQNSWHSARSTL